MKCLLRLRFETRERDFRIKKLSKSDVITIGIYWRKTGVRSVRTIKKKIKNSKRGKKKIKVLLTHKKKGPRVFMEKIKWLK